MGALITDKPIGERVELINVDGQSQEFVSGVLAGTDIGFTPESPANWPIAAPTNVESALDGLALIAAGGAANAGVLAAAAVNTFNFPSLVTSFKSGNFLLWAHISCTASGVANITIELLADAVVLATLVVVAGGAGSVGGAVSTFVALSRVGTHQFTVRATASAGTVTTPIGRAQITYQELGG